MMGVIEYCNWQISEWIRAYYADSFFLILVIVAYIYLYINYKELRYKFLLPVFLMMLFIVNPILYAYIFQKIIYWRLFWILPASILIAAAVVVLLKKLDKSWKKWGLLLVAIGFIVSQGEYIFSSGMFTPRSNWEKVSQETIEVCDIILELDESPRVVAHSDINIEIRQYAPEIELMYGRDALGEYIRYPKWPTHAVYESYAQIPVDYNNIFVHAFYHGYDFVVTPAWIPVGEEVLVKYEYKEVGRTSQYVIYNNSEVYNRVE